MLSKELMDHIEKNFKVCPVCKSTRVVFTVKLDLETGMYSLLVDCKDCHMDAYPTTTASGEVVTTVRYTTNYD